MNYKTLLIRIFKTVASITMLIVALFAFGVASMMGEEVGKTIGSSSATETQQEAADAMGITLSEYQAKLTDLNQEVRGMPEEESNLYALESVSRELNKSLPKMIDEVTRRERTTTGPGLTINYEHTLLREYPTASGKRQFSAYMRESLESQLCDKEWAQKLHGHGGAYRYVYHTEDGDLLADIRIGRKECR